MDRAGCGDRRLVRRAGLLRWRGLSPGPPIPERIVTDGGRVIYTASDIREGQNVWQSMGGQEVGTVWGHGAYVAPDWSADYLHREAAWLLDHCHGTGNGKHIFWNWRSSSYGIGVREAGPPIPVQEARRRDRGAADMGNASTRLRTLTAQRRRQRHRQDLSSAVEPGDGVSSADVSTARSARNGPSHHPVPSPARTPTGPRPRRG